MVRERTWRESHSDTQIDSQRDIQRDKQITDKRPGQSHRSCQKHVRLCSPNPSSTADARSTIKFGYMYVETQILCALEPSGAPHLADHLPVHLWLPVPGILK